MEVWLTPTSEILKLIAVVLMTPRSGPITQRAEKALARTRAYRGNIAKQLNTPPKTVVPKSQQRASEFRGHSDEVVHSGARLREVGDARRRAESLRPEDPRIPANLLFIGQLLAFLRIFCASSRLVQLVALLIKAGVCSAIGAEVGANPMPG